MAHSRQSSFTMWSPCNPIQNVKVGAAEFILESASIRARDQLGMLHVDRRKKPVKLTAKQLQRLREIFRRIEEIKCIGNKRKITYFPREQPRQTIAHKIAHDMLCHYKALMSDDISPSVALASDLDFESDRSEPIAGPSSITSGALVLFRRSVSQAVEALCYDESEEESCSYRPEDYINMLPCYARNLTGYITKLDGFPVSIGGCSNVYRGQSRLHKGRLIAIKEIRLSGSETRLLRRTVRELQVSSGLSHPNILTPLGFAIDLGLRTVSIITEWMVNGTVTKYLSDRRNRNKIHSIAKDIGTGIDYLHQMGVVHSDLKCENVVVSRTGSAKLIDFGLSKRTSSKLLYITPDHYSTLRWMAYEQLTVEEDADCIPYTECTDVWSYGMTILEMLTNDVPYAYIRNELRVIKTIMEGKLPKFLPSYNDWNAVEKRLWSICHTCWRLDPSLRPTMSDLLSELAYLDDSYQLSYAF